MKYYLNESIKYILSEQFILNEAMKHSELIVQCVAIREYIKKLLDELENGKNLDKNLIYYSSKKQKDINLITPFLSRLDEMRKI